jgi:hypothetical protein
MRISDWQKALDKLNSIMAKQSKHDAYVTFNVVAPLRRRLLNGEHSNRLYREIMELDRKLFQNNSNNFENKAIQEK